MSELKYWVWLATRKGIGPLTLGDLLRHFGSPEDVFFARSEHYRAVLSHPVESLEDKNLSESRRIIDECREKHIHILTLGDAQYPERLRNIADAPLVVYCKGHLPAIDDEAAVAVVGTRSCTPYGIKTAERISYEITRAGGVIVTGLAHGIDSAAARGALRAGGCVVGVLGCGIDIVYPPSNAVLFEDVATIGALVSEYPPGTKPSRQSFPARNRIISGLSVGVVVVEAPRGSGALITAGQALEQGRDVFAVPGNIDAASCVGSNALLREGAYAVTSGWDVIDEYRHLFPHRLGRAETLVPLDGDMEEKLVKGEMEHVSEAKQPKKPAEKPQKEREKWIDKENNEDYSVLSVSAGELSDDELTVARAMTEKSLHVDDIIERSGLGTGEVLSALTMLEIEGYVTQETGKRFTLNIVIE